MKPGVTQALSCDDMTVAVETVATVVLTVLAVSAVGAAHVAPITQRRNVTIVGIFFAAV